MTVSCVLGEGGHKISQEFIKKRIGSRLSRLLKVTQQVVNTRAQLKIAHHVRIQHCQHVVKTVEVQTSQSVKRNAQRKNPIIEKVNRAIKQVET